MISFHISQVSETKMLHMEYLLACGKLNELSDISILLYMYCTVVFLSIVY